MIQRQQVHLKYEAECMMPSRHVSPRLWLNHPRIATSASTHARLPHVIPPRYSFSHKPPFPSNLPSSNHPARYTQLTVHHGSETSEIIYPALNTRNKSLPEPPEHPARIATTARRHPQEPERCGTEEDPALHVPGHGRHGVLWHQHGAGKQDRRRAE